MNGLQTVLRKAGNESAAALLRGNSERSPEQREQAGMPRFLAPPALQAKREVGREDDPLEREADAVADTVTQDQSTLARFLSPAGSGRGDAAAPAHAGTAARTHAQPAVRRKTLRADPPDDGQGEPTADCRPGR